MHQYAPVRRPQVTLGSGLTILAAIWLIISPWVLRADTAQAYWSDVLVGVAVGIIALLRYTDTYDTSWLSWVNIVLGVWVIVSPWILFFGAGQMYWSNVIDGILLLCFIVYSGAGNIPLFQLPRRASRRRKRL